MKSIEKLSDDPVSILKPLRGADENLMTNLESFFVMNYKTYELLFCIEDKDDPAIEVVKNLMHIYPNVDAQLIHGGAKVGINPKINNMNPGYLKSKYDLIMISDDKMLIQPNALQEMVNKITSDPKVGCVFQMPSIYAKKQGFSVFIDKLFFGIFSAIVFLGIMFRRPLYVNGMSALYKKTIFEQVGGMQFFGKFLLEDLHIHWFCHRQGYKVEMSRFLGLQNQEETGLRFQLTRFRRWLALLDFKTSIGSLLMFLIL